METYVKIPDRIMYRKKLSPAAKLLYGLILSLCQSRGFCWATNSALAERMAMSRRSISRLLAELRQCGLVLCDQNDAGTVGLNVRRLLRLTEPEEETDPPQEDWGEWARRCVATMHRKRKEQDLERDEPEDEESSCFGAPEGLQALGGLPCPSAPVEGECPPLPEHWGENGDVPQPEQAEKPAFRKRSVSATAGMPESLMQPARQTTAPASAVAAGMPERSPEQQARDNSGADRQDVRQTAQTCQQPREYSGTDRQTAVPPASPTRTDPVLDCWMQIRHRDWSEGDRAQFFGVWRAYWLDRKKQGQTLPGRADRHSFLERLNRLAGGDRETMKTILRQNRLSQ